VSVVPQTGQTDSYEDGDDGYLQRGLPWPDPRFTDNEDGTVTDNLTQLIWLKNADSFGQRRSWSDALTDCNALADGNYGLTDGSVAGDWRLPNVRELNSLIHYGVHTPALPDTAGTSQGLEGYGYYWSSTMFAAYPGHVWVVSMVYGFVNTVNKDSDVYVWPVRGGFN